MGFEALVEQAHKDLCSGCAVSVYVHGEPKFTLHRAYLPDDLENRLQREGFQEVYRALRWLGYEEPVEK